MEAPATPSAYVVTGGARGIGRAVAEHLAGEGSRVALVDNGCLVDGSGTRSELVEEVADALVSGGADVLGLPLDVRDIRAIGLAVEQVVSRWGRVDGLVNAAAILRTGNVMSMSPDDWDQTLDANLTGTLQINRAVIRHWLEAGTSGRIINFTSTAGLEGIPDMLAYATSKAGVIGMTLALANTVARKGITVNAVAPNASTRMAVRGMGDVSLQTRAATGEWPEIATTGLPPRGIGVLCSYLLSPTAESVTGRIFTVIGQRYGRIALPTEEVVVWLPEGASQEEANEMLHSTLGQCLGPEPRWVSADPLARSQEFPVTDLG